MQPHEYVVLEVSRERERQINVEGWNSAHDDAHDKNEMARAAACYAWHAWKSEYWRGNAKVPAEWPWAREWWKPTTRRRDLVKAAALIVAEIERLDRLEEVRAALASQ